MENEMKKLVEKEKELIKKPIIDFFEEKLLDEFRNRKGQLVLKVKSIFLLTEVDEDQSGFKENIKITRVDVQAVVIVKLEHGATTNNTLSLRTNKGFILNYNNDIKEYLLEEMDGVSIIDVSVY